MMWILINKENNPIIFNTDNIETISAESDFNTNLAIMTNETPKKIKMCYKSTMLEINVQEFSDHVYPHLLKPIKKLAYDMLVTFYKITPMEAMRISADNPQDS